MNFKNLVLVSAVLFSGAVLSADECKKDCPPPKKEMRHGPDKHHGKKNKFRIYGQVMNSMTAEERKEMDELFRTDKEEFKKRMDAKVEKLRQEQKAKFMKIRELKKEYAQADDAKKAEIKAELRKLVADGYAKRLEKTRKHVEMMRKNADAVENKLKESEANADKNIDKHVERILNRTERKPGRRGPGKIMPGCEK